MAKQVNTTEGKPSLNKRLQDFIQEVRVELSKVTWPTMDDLKVSTKVTMYLLGIMAAVIFCFDHIFQFAVLMLLRLAT